MKQNKVLILGKELLLNEGMKIILTQQANLEVKDDYIADLQSLPEALYRLQPRIIVVDLSSYGGKLLDVYHALATIPSIRIILINLSINKVEVFDRTVIQINQFSDFLQTFNLGLGGELSTSDFSYAGFDIESPLEDIDEK